MADLFYFSFQGEILEILEILAFKFRITYFCWMEPFIITDCILFVSSDNFCLYSILPNISVDTDLSFCYHIYHFPSFLLVGLLFHWGSFVFFLKHFIIIVIGHDGSAFYLSDNIFILP